MPGISEGGSGAYWHELALWVCLPLLFCKRPGRNLLDGSYSDNSDGGCVGGITTTTQVLRSPIKPAASGRA